MAVLPVAPSCIATADSDNKGRKNDEPECNRPSLMQVVFCNGVWCDQSPDNVENLLRFGCPAHKTNWHCDSMQDWEILELSTVKP